MTLIEVLAVVVILGLLAGTLAVGFQAAFSRGKREIAKTGMQVIVEKLNAYKLDRGQWPEASTGLSALSDGQADPSDIFYLGPDALLDPWNNPYHYVTPGPDGHPFEIVCFGADGQPGGEGENADLRSTRMREGAADSGSAS